MAAVLARLIRNKKILLQVEKRTKQKALYLESEIEATRELGFEIEEDYPTANAIVSLSPAV